MVFVVSTREQLYQLLSRACILGHTLPNQVLYDYEKAVETEINSKGIVDTEAIAQIKRRVGQDRYRKALVDYWGGCCAVTGVSNSTLLRASHAKGWAECDSDAERLDVYNGFLLCVNLDCVFDAGLISFDDDGRIMISTALSSEDLATLNIRPDMRLSKIQSQHRNYLTWHRDSLIR